jgi:hypothetical protein
MMMMTSLMLFISIAFVILIGLLISKVLGSRIWTPKLSGSIVLGYIALGVIALCVLHFSTTGEKRISNERVKEIFEADMHIWNALIDGQTSSQYEDYVDKEWQFELSSNQITVHSEFHIDFEVGIIVEKRNDPDSNVIYAKTYVIPYQYKGIDYTEQANIEFFEYQQDELFVKQVPNQEFRFYQINPRMEILAQLKDKNYFEDEAYYRFSTGRTILFLNVPSHVNIKDESGFVKFVNK